MFRKTKIVCTIGPASDTEETIKKLFEAGMNASRHNFSHGTHETHKVAMDKVKKVAAQMGVNYAIILDTKGPEIRTRNFKGGKVMLTEGSVVTVVGGEEFLGDETRFAVTYKDLAEVLKVGNHILLNDGLVDLEVIAIEGKDVKTVVKNTGEIGDHKSSNLPGVKTNLPSLTEKDASDLQFAVDNDVDIVAASFIRKAEDVLNIRKVLHEAGGSKIHVYSKIENQEGVDNVEEIIKYSDGIMVARGDLGVEIPIERVPVVQKRIIDLCNKAGKPVITATQMLDSMVRNPRPTRAEVSDVANAIMDGSDAVMLSGETASGKYPVETVKTMAHIAMETEQGIDYQKLLREKLENQTTTVQSAISAAVTLTANKLNAKAIIAGTQSGSTARNIAKFKPQATIIAVTPDKFVARKLALNWGVYPIVSEGYNTTDELISKTAQAAKDKGYVEDGDIAVISAGIPIHYSGSTNMMKIQVIGDAILEGSSAEQTTQVVSGVAIVAKSLQDAVNRVDVGAILIVESLTNDYMPLLSEVGGIVVESGNVATEISIEAMKREIPVVYGAKGAAKKLVDGTMITLDGKRAIVLSGQTGLTKPWANFFRKFNS